jgi:hypothetical protein
MLVPMSPKERKQVMYLDTSQAVCATADPEIFFTDSPMDTLAAKGLCQRCPIMTDCLDMAMGENIKDGIWGGATPKEREQFKRNPKAKLRHIYIDMGRKLDDFLEEYV